MPDAGGLIQQAGADAQQPRRGGHPAHGGSRANNKNLQHGGTARVEGRGAEVKAMQGCVSAQEGGAVTSFPV